MTEANGTTANGVSVTAKPEDITLTDVALNEVTDDKVEIIVSEPKEKAQSKPFITPQDTPQEVNDEIKFVSNVIKSPGGILLLINLVMMLIGWIIIAAYQWDGVDSIGATDFYLIIVIVSWLGWAIVYVFLLFNVASKFRSVNWPLSLLICAALDALLLFIVSVCAAERGVELEQSAMGVAALFGFLAVIGLCIQAWFHWEDYNFRKNQLVNKPVGS